METTGIVNDIVDEIVTCGRVFSFLNNFELCYRGTSFNVQGGSVIAAVFLVHNYVSEQFGNYVQYGMYCFRK